MKKMYLWILLAISFGTLNAKAQSREEINQLRKYTSEYLTKALANNTRLELDTVWVGRDDIATLSLGGKYDMVENRMALTYLATLVDDQELKDRIDIANAHIPVLHKHEESHKTTLPLMIRDHNFGGVGKSFGWSAFDFAQANLSDELSARLSEIFAVRHDLVSGALSKNDIKILAKNMPLGQSHFYNYYMYLATHNANETLGKKESDIMLDALITWMTDGFSNAVVHNFYAKNAVDGARSRYFDYVYQFKKLRGNTYSKLYKNSDFAQNEIFLDFDEFIKIIFSKNHFDKDVDIFGLASPEKKQEFLKTIALVLDKYRSQLNEIDKEFSAHPGWRKSKAKLEKMSNNKLSVKRHAQSILRAEQFSKEND
ncbi:MAG: hypothetical protein LBR41_03315 [Rickettsiales bacterium]|jgi:hypothetical protein|nr:hypothetical protein [Rickettsiales bacterium]